MSSSGWRGLGWGKQHTIREEHSVLRLYVTVRHSVRVHMLYAEEKLGYPRPRDLFALIFAHDASFVFALRAFEQIAWAIHRESLAMEND